MIDFILENFELDKNIEQQEMQLEKNIPLLQTKVRQTLENYELADARYEVGLGNFIELQDAKENYNNAQKRHCFKIQNRFSRKYYRKKSCRYVYGKRDSCYAE